MDFVSCIRDQMSRLNSRDYVNYVWKEEIPNKSFGHRNVPHPSDTCVEEFTNHLPLFVDQFWESALVNLKSSHLTIQDFDEDLRVYIMVLLHFCMSPQDGISHNCVMYASEVYLNLLTTDLSEELYRTKLYKISLQALQDGVVAGVLSTQNRSLMQTLRKFLSHKAKLQSEDLEVTLAALVHVIFIKNHNIYLQFDLNCECNSISHEAFLAIKSLLQNEATPSKIFMISTYLFIGVRKCETVHITPNYLNMLQTNFRHFIKDSHEKFNEDHYKTFMNAFIHVWKHPNFVYYEEAVLIMNNLNAKHYRTLLDVLNKMVVSKESHKNLLRLSLAIIFNPPGHTPLEKIKVNNEILTRNILLNILSNKSELSNTALATFGELIMSPSLQKDTVLEPVKTVVNCSDRSLLDTETILRGLKSLMVKKWGVKSRNKPLFSVIISIMNLSNEDHPEVYAEILEFLTEEASPFDLKPFVSHLFNLYPELYRRNFKSSALEILKVIFKLALHPMASSGDFVKHLYSVMVAPHSDKNNSNIYITPIISENFNYKEFFRKCGALGLIHGEHVSRRLDMIGELSEADLKFVSAIVGLTDYRSLSPISDYIQNNFMTLGNSPNVKYILYIFNTIAKNSSSTDLHKNLKHVEVAISFVKEHLQSRNFRYNAISNAFSLLKTLDRFGSFTNFYSNVQEEFNSKLDETLPTENSFLPLYYSAQLVLFKQLAPNDNNIKKITDFLTLCSDDIYIRDPEFSPQIQIGCLNLLTNVSIIKPNLIDSTLNFLQHGLNSPTRAVKLAAIDLMFDVCNMVTHSFEEFINFMFMQLVGSDNVFKRTCLEKIDKLLREDYLKLDLNQFLILACILGDKECGLGEYWHQILSEHFYISNTTVIAKYFVPLIIHINNYRKHPVYVRSDNNRNLDAVVRKVVDRRKIYSQLFNNLPIKLRFGVVATISAQILDLILKDTVRYAEGFWNMTKDSAYIFKLLGMASHDGESTEEYYKKIMGKVSTLLLQRNKEHHTEKRDNAEYQKEIVSSTCTLLRVLFHNNSNDVQKHLNISLFDAIIHWTDFLMADLIFFIHVERSKDLENYYIKLEKFYKANTQNLLPNEESF